MCALLTACSAAAMLAVASAQSVADQQAALGTVTTFVNANERAGLDLIMSTFAEDATVFLPGEPSSRLSGKASIRRACSSLFAQRSGPIVITPIDVDVQAIGDIAIVTAHLQRSARGTSRRSFVLKRTGDAWLIVHLHASNIQAP